MQAVLHAIDSEALTILAETDSSDGIEFVAPAEPGAYIAVHDGPIYLDIIAVLGENVAICINSDFVPPELEHHWDKMSENFCRFCS